MTQKTYQTETIGCPTCAAKIERALKADGIKKAEVLFNSSRVRVEFDENIITSDAIKQRIQKLGFKVLSEK